MPEPVPQDLPGVGCVETRENHVAIQERRHRRKFGVVLNDTPVDHALGERLHRCTLGRDAFGHLDLQAVLANLNSHTLLTSRFNVLSRNKESRESD